MRRFLIVSLAGFALLILLAAGCFLWLRHYVTASGPLQETTNVLIEPGTSGSALTQKLADESVIDSPLAFRLSAIMNGRYQSFQAGEYRFEPGVTPQQVMEKLAKGDVVTYSVTVPEGLTTAQILALLQAQEDLTGKIAEKPAEGTLLPETYHHHRGTERNALITRMQRAHVELMDKLWPERQDGLPFNTPEEAVTLASIVEKETRLPEERPHVAAVYLNRLRVGMPLQADPTVAYGHYGGQSADRPITLKDLKEDHPYNTYTRKGLPPGPICHPGAESIKAVLQPADRDELYFVADGKGGHVFARDYNEHLRNVREYRKWQREQRKLVPAQ